MTRIIFHNTFTKICNIKIFLIMWADLDTRYSLGMDVVDYRHLES